nr:AAA family ATPase [Candidatus Woesearchaeota archaeon]
MKIESIKLHNIRSFVDQEINFPDGSILLSGDIGSGKSSILYAVEFALFGLIKAEVTGNELLRNGTDSGSVTLNFNIDGKKVEIKRNLKLSKTAVQDSGYIIIDGKKEELTPNELKQRILEILNYPMEFLTKSKSFIYRYTVYTPQEDMKKILLEKREERINTLRRIFGIDKYKRIEENCRVLTTHLRESRKRLEGKAEDLDKLENNKIELQSKRDSIRNNINILNQQIEKYQIKLQENRKLLEDAEKLRKISNQLEMLQRDIGYKKEKEAENINLAEKLKKDIENLEKELSSFKEENYQDQTKDIKKTISMLENDLYELNKKSSYIQAKKDNSKRIMDDITKMSFCPLCKQEVTSDHKHNIAGQENINISMLENEIMKFSNDINEIKGKIESETKKLDEIIIKQREYDLTHMKRINLDEKKSRIDEVNKLMKQVKDELNDLAILESNLKKDIEIIKFIDHEKIKSQFEELFNQLRKLEVERAGLENEVKNIVDNLNKIQEGIDEKIRIKHEIERINELNNWLNESFLNLMRIIERKIMLKVYHDFNNLFQKWFNILVDTEELEIKLDEEFTPKIIQNGYDIDYGFLSGGEKTAAALAYRLALNQVINNIITNINTNDIIILDEPTDGFSEQQLERMRLVLDELKINQIIIVSHEAKIESFVDNVIRLKKENHISHVT